MKLDRDLTYAENLVLNLLPKKKPIKSEEVVDRNVIHRVTHLDKREISYIIEELRKYYPICSTRSNKGYWLGNKEEALLFAKQCRHHADGLIQTAKNIEDMFNYNDDLDDFGDKSDELLV